jgi:ABC-type multidrug transport system fused ATPase/permease subunit
LKVTVYLYFIGFVIYIFIVGALLVIFGIISLIIIWIILWFMDYQSGYETYKIVRKGSKKHLIEKGAIVDTDHGELHETLTGKLKTRKIIGKDYELEDQSKIISPGTTYKVKKSDGEEGTMKKSTLLGDYEYEKKE